MLEELVSIALIGTQRQKKEIPTFSNENLNKVLSQLNKPDTEGNLLSAIAILSIYKQAGKMPLKLEGKVIEPCELDDLPVFSNPNIDELFSLIIEGRYVNLLKEFLELLSKTSCRMTEKYITWVLNYGASHTDLRESVCKVIGKRGHWLAEQNSAWAYARVAKQTNLSDEEIWQTGNKSARTSLLKEIRKKDPKKAREFVLSTWKEEPTDNRFLFISAFKENLSLDDEDFLEKALDDKAKDIREQAEKLLSCLPKSKFHARMQERLRLIISIKTEKKKITLEIDLPEKLDEGATRDIVNINPSNKTIGQKAWWLQKIVQVVEPNFWSKQLNRPPEDILLLMAKSDWANNLLPALTASICNHLALDWAKKLIQLYIEKKIPLYVETMEEIFLILPVLEKEDLLKFLLKKGEKFHPSQLIARLFYKHNLTWDKDLVREVLGKALQLIKNNNDRSKKADPSFSYFLEYIVPYIPETMVQETLSLFAEENFTANQWFVWEAALDKFINLLKIRQKMLKEFSL